MPICFSFARKGRCRLGNSCHYRHVNPRAGSKKTRDKSPSRSQPRPWTPSVDHIAEFFDSYPTFRYDPSASFIDEFFDLCSHLRWERDDDERRVARRRLEDAIARQFNEMYGTSVNDLEAWQGLCRTIGIKPVPASLKECCKVVIESHLNICDLIAAPKTGKTRRFPTEDALVSYSERTGRVIARQNVHAGPLLRFLLRQR